MLIVKNKGQTEAFHYVSQSLEVNEVINGEFSLTATARKTNENIGFDLLDGNAIVEWEGREFRIKQFQKTPYQKSFTAFSTFFELKGKQKHDIFGGSHTLSQFLDYVLAGTGWTYEVVDIPETVLIPNFGNENALKLIEVLVSSFNCERRIMPNQHLTFQKMIGEDKDAQYRYGHNIKTINYSYDDTDVYTSIKGIGGDGLEVMYTSPNAAIYPNFGEAPPFKDERFTIPENLLEEMKRNLKDEPEIAIEMDGLELTDKDLGERLWLIHEPLNTTFKTRVMAKKTREPAERSSVVIGNALPKSQSDQLAEQKVEIDENKKQTYSKFEQTNEKINLEVGRLDGAILEAHAAITITADEIRSEVSAINTSLTGEIATANSVISQLAGQVSLKADATTVNGQINSVMVNLNALSGEISSIVSFTDVDGSEIISKVNQSASLFKVEAKNIQLDGITQVAESLTVGYGFEGNKDIYFYNGGALTSFSDATSMEVSAPGDLYLSANEIRFDAYGATSNKSKINFSTAESINWGTHAPDTTARFG